jgi:hypothetical protein
VRGAAWILAAVGAALLSVGVARADTGSSVRTRLVAEVEQGLTAANRRWAWQGWYQDFPGVPGWASIWDTQQLFEAYLALEKAAPSTRHHNMLLWFAAQSERGYFDASLGGGVGGFSTGYDHGGDGRQWFDDNGWLGLSFLDAYRETHRRRFLRDAETAFRYLYEVGRDPTDGGIWWNTDRTLKAAESIDTAVLLAVELWQLHAGAGYLAHARQLIGAADALFLDRASGLYVNHTSAGVPVSYLESPMLSAFVRLCRAAGLYCDRVAPLTEAMLTRFGGDLRQPPQFDAAYVRYLLDVYELTHDARLYQVAYRNALRIEQNALDPAGYFSKAWDGSQSGASPGLISVHGAALEALAWTAAETPAQ